MTYTLPLKKEEKAMEGKYHVWHDFSMRDLTTELLIKYCCSIMVRKRKRKTANSFLLLYPSQCYFPNYNSIEKLYHSVGNHYQTRIKISYIL